MCDPLLCSAGQWQNGFYSKNCCIDHPAVCEVWNTVAKWVTWDCLASAALSEVCFTQGGEVE